MLKKEEFEKAVERLQQPFALRDLDWVPNFTYPKADQKTYENTMIGIAPYVRREAIITRLNVVIGAGNWENRLEPLGKFGLYHGIAINCEGDWVTKFDGSQIYETNTDMDAIKSVVTQSIKRASEVWGIGLYLKFIPKLFAKKMPEDYYDADEVWSGQSASGYIKIRWDHPDLPQEYLPDYMTPEQYARMKRIRRYFGEDKKEKATLIIKEWEKDHTMIKYQIAEQIIDAVEENLKARMGAIRPTEVYKTPAPKRQGARPKAPKVETPTPEPPAQKKDPQSEGISSEEFTALYAKVIELKEITNAELYADGKILAKIKEELNWHHKGKSAIGQDALKFYTIELDKWIALASDDLPF